MSYKTFFLIARSIFSFAFLIAGIALSALSAEAYLAYNHNRNVREEVQSQPFRIFPGSEKWAFAVDADFFKPLFLNNLNSERYVYDYYHGNGFWMDGRFEFAPVQNLIFNIKSTLTQGTSSNGPGYLFVPYARVGVTYRFLSSDIQNEFRLSDVDRQTVGLGLFVEDKIVNGAYWKSEWAGAQFKFLVDGTGNFKLDGGLYAAELSIANGGLGGSIFVFETERYGDYTTSPTGTVFTRWGGGNLRAGFEGAFNYRAYAGMGYLDWKWSSEPWTIRFKPQARYYGSKIMGNLPGNIENIYVAYEMNDLPFLNFMSLMSKGDDVIAYGALLNIAYRPNHFYQLFFEGEPVYFDFVKQENYRYPFFRTGFKLFPMVGREDSLGFLIGNKFLSASSNSFGFRRYTTPTDVDLENRTIFVEQFYMMFNFEVHF